MNKYFIIIICVLLSGVLVVSIVNILIKIWSEENKIYLKTRIIFTIQKLRKGVYVGMHPTMKCNLSCTYCIADIFLGERPVFKNELTATEWLKKIDDYPERITVITMSGGDPTMYKDIIPLVNGLIKRKIAVRIITNIMAINLMKINASSYVRIFTTYHHGFANRKTFDKNLIMYRTKFAVETNEIEGMGKYIKGSSTMPFSNSIKDECRIGGAPLFIPDGRVVGGPNSQDVLADNYKVQYDLGN